MGDDAARAVRHTFRYLVAEPPVAGEELALSPGDSHHLSRVVRRRPGDEVELADGAGRLWPAVVVAAGPRATVRVGEPRDAPRPPAVSLHLGLTDWARVDLVVEKAAELGVQEVTLMTSERARRIPGADAWERRRRRLERVAEAAGRQSGQAWLPRLRGLVPFDDALAEIPSGEGCLIDPRGDAAVSAVAGRSGRAALLVGPQAGFSEAEVERAREAGLAVCGLGPAVLRTETAAIAAVTLALAAVGRLEGGVA
jgi:16S rRNA (uracil1498-N3)-methyltransferase